MNDSVSAISRYLHCYFLVVALDEFHMFRFENDNPKRTTRLATGWTEDKNNILALTTHLTTVAVSDRYGVHLYTYDEGPYSHKLLVGSDTRDSVIASTTLGGIVLFIPLSRDEHMLLKHVQWSMARDPLTAPILGADHAQFRFSVPKPSYPYPTANPDVGFILDEEMLSQFLELSDVQKEKILPDSDKRLKVVSLLERASALNSV